MSRMNFKKIQLSLLVLALASSFASTPVNAIPLIATVVPEPDMFALVAIGLLGFLGIRRL
jgi:hypothetical protein